MFPPLEYPHVTTINRNPHLVGQIAISEGLLTPEKLAECIQLQASEPAGRALGGILVQKGYLTLDQLDWVISIQKSRFHRISADPARGGLFGQIALRLDYITSDQLNECLREQQEARDDSMPLIGQILLRKRYLTNEQSLEVLHRQNKEVAKCPGCGVFYDVHGRYPGNKFVCSKCSTIIP
ncbi:MAG TPA: hypothetical protein VKU80_00385 [Planctomycetota bacterium]|nr:hypothetical protein [Planctomycetota bacterium]